MKIILVSPPFGAHGQRSKGLPIAPPVLEYLAGLTQQLRPQVAVRLIDANVEPFAPDTMDADLVGFTVLTPQAPFVYAAADALRRRGIPVILGGIHVQACPDEARRHGTILLGEAEEVWGAILDDAGARKLQPEYQGGRPALDNLPRPRTDLWDRKYTFGSFFTARGCPFDCTFCSVHGFFGRAVRFRPIAEVVGEVAASPRRLFWGLDDNVWGTDLARNLELYREMAKNIRGKYWFGSADLVTAGQPGADELLSWARRAGLRAVLVGWESENPASLSEYRAVAKQGGNREDALRRIRDHGIEVMLFVMVGGRRETLDDYRRVLELCDRLDVAAHPTMITPFPGTDLYASCRPDIYPDRDSWDWFDGNHALFRHDDPAMTRENREHALLWLRAELFTLPRILRRIRRIARAGFPASHIMSWMLQYPQGRAFREFLAARSDVDPKKIRQLLFPEGERSR